MVLLKKVLVGMVTCVGFSVASPSFANDVTLDISTVVSQGDISLAASDFVNILKSKPGFSSLQLDGVNGYTGNFTFDNKANSIKNITFTEVGVEVSGVPIFNIYSPTITMSADISSDCATISNEKYTVKRTNPLLDGTFKGDLDKNGKVLFKSLLKNSNLKDYCQK